MRQAEARSSRSGPTPIAQAPRATPTPTAHSHEAQEYSIPFIRKCIYDKNQIQMKYASRSEFLEFATRSCRRPFLRRLVHNLQRCRYLDDQLISQFRNYFCRKRKLEAIVRKIRLVETAILGKRNDIFGGKFINFVPVNEQFSKARELF